VGWSKTLFLVARQEIAKMIKPAAAPSVPVAAQRTATKLPYELKQGTHYEPGDDGLPVMYNRQPNSPPVYVMSDRRLDEIFENKFSKVTEVQLSALLPVPEERKADVQSLIEAGTWTEEDREFLEHLPEDKFGKFMKTAGIKPTVAAGTETEDHPTLLGEDVTTKFKKAKEAGLRVFRNPAGKHQVVKPDALQKPVNMEPLEANQVDKWVVDHKSEI
jgi:hypothetical protein